MKKLLTFTLLLLFSTTIGIAFVGDAFAQDEAKPPSVPVELTEDTITAHPDKAVGAEFKAPKIPEGETTPDQIASAVESTVHTWQSVGWFAGLMWLCYVLVLLSKFKFVDSYLKKWGVKWIRPLLAAVFGAVAGAVTAYAAGQPIVQVILTGVMAGFGSTGFHEVLSILTSKKERERRAT